MNQTHPLGAAHCIMTRGQLVLPLKVDVDLSERIEHEHEPPSENHGSNMCMNLCSQVLGVDDIIEDDDVRLGRCIESLHIEHGDEIRSLKALSSRASSESNPAVRRDPLNVNDFDDDNEKPRRQVDIQSQVPKPLDQVAQLECGGDVLFPDSQFPVTVENLRNHERDPRDPADLLRLRERPTATLHRLVLRTVGRPLYEYTNEQELLMGFKDALIGHQRLCRAGVLHRDISIGNVFLKNPEPGTENYGGFVSDLDIVRIEESTITAPKVETRVSHNYQPVAPAEDHGGVVFNSEERTTKQALAQIPIERGVDLTGTVQFMAHELIAAALKGRRIQPSVRHDVESFIWVLYCAVLRYLLDRFQNKSMAAEVKAEKAYLEELNCDAFAQSDPKRIRESRRGGGTIGEFPTLPGIKNTVGAFMSPHLVEVFAEFQCMLYFAHAPRNATILTYESVINVIDEALTAIRQA